MESRVLPSAQYAITARVSSPHEPGWLARVASVIAAQGGAIGAIDLVQIQNRRSLRDYTIECSSSEHAQRIADALSTIDDVSVQSVSDKTFLMHLGGKLSVVSRVPLKTRADLSMAYTPGVARVCMAIHEAPLKSFNLTIRRNCVAVISDGSAVLGLGDIGAEAALPVMEGKAILFKEFGDVDAFPLCVDIHDAKGLIAFCKAVAPTFGGINLEDIAAPKCFEIEEALRHELGIPVFHDDQHGTAVVVMAALINAAKLLKIDIKQLKVVVAGAGAAGVACTKILLECGVSNVVVCDRAGAIHAGRDYGDNAMKRWLAEHTNPESKTGSLKQVLRGAGMFLGVSAPNLLTREDILTMSARPIIFALSNPVPEVMPESIEDIAGVIGTGRSDYPNQINNVLAFPGIFRGALSVRASDINAEMKRAAAHAIADTIKDSELSADYIVPSVFNRKVAKAVAKAVSRAARQTHVAHRVPKETEVSL